jgi:hypothetical protein
MNIALAGASLSLFVAAAPALAEPPDPRCRAHDRAITAKVNALLQSDDIRSTTQAYAAVSQLLSARVDCSQAKTASALNAYRELEDRLDRQTPAALAKAP